MFKAKCQDCDWKLDCEIEGRGVEGPGEIIFNHGEITRLGRHLVTEQIEEKLNRFVLDIHTPL